MKELKYFRRDEMMQVPNLVPNVLTAPSVSSIITCRKAPGFSEKKCFLPNEPKVIQCLPGNLKKREAISKPNKANFCLSSVALAEEEPPKLHPDIPTRVRIGFKQECCVWSSIRRRVDSVSKSRHLT
jgi:hypothetical protein